MPVPLVLWGLCLQHSQVFSPVGKWGYDSITLRNINAPLKAMHGQFGSHFLKKKTCALTFFENGVFIGEGLKGRWRVQGSSVTVTVLNRAHALDYIQARKPGTVNDTEMTYSFKDHLMTWWDGTSPRKRIFSYVRIQP